MNSMQDKRLLVLVVTFVFLLSGCNTESSSVGENFSQEKKSCKSEDKGSAEFWERDENKTLESFAHFEASNLSIKLRDGEYLLSRDLGHLDEPEFEDMLIASDSLPYLVKLVCSDGSNLE